MNNIIYRNSLSQSKFFNTGNHNETLPELSVLSALYSGSTIERIKMAEKLSAIQKTILEPVPLQGAHKR